MKEVTDPKLLKQLSGPVEVTDPEILNQLNGEEQSDGSGYFSGLTDSLASGMTFGLVDEVSAAGGATGRALKQLTTGEDVDWSGNYDALLAEKRGEAKQFSQENPIASGAASVAGGFANPLAKIPVAGTLGQQAAQGAKIGAAMGAGYGAGTSEGDLSERGTDALIQGTVGAALGASAPYVLRGISSGVNKGVSALRKSLFKNGSTISERKVAHQVKRLGGGDLKKGMEVVKQRIQEGGPDTVLADVLDIGGQKMMRAAANIPGKAAQQADDFVTQRMAGRGGRLQSAADELAPNSFYDDMERITRQRSADAAPLYQKAFERKSSVEGKVFSQWDDRLQQFLDDPIVKKGMAKGIRVQQLESLAENKPFNFQEYAVKGFDEAGDLLIDGTPNLRAMDAAKRGLDDILEGYRDKTTGKVRLDEYGRAVDKVRKALVGKLDDITTDESGYSAYKAARDAWAGPSKVMDAAYRGRNFIKGDSEITAKTLNSLTDAEKEAFQLGARRELSKLINSDTQTALTKFANKKADFWNKMEVVFTDKKSLGEFRRQITNEAKKKSLEQFIAPKAGSQTTPLKEDIADLNRLPENGVRALEAVGDLISGHPFRAAANAAKPALDRLTAPSQKTAEGLSNLLLSPNAPQFSQMPNRLLISPDMERAMGRGLLVGGSSR